MTYYILCTITNIISYPVPISCLLSCSGYTPMLYFLFFIFILVLSYTFILYLLSCTFHMLSSCTIHILHIHLYVLILSYTLCFRILYVLFLYWFKTNTFISYLYFSYYVNLIFPISRRSIRLILLLSYHILSYVFIYVFMCFHILYFSYNFLFYLLSIIFVYYTLYFLYTVSMYCSCTIFIYLYSCTVHFIYCFPVILFI